MNPKLKQEQTERTETDKISVSGACSRHVGVTSCSIPLRGDKKCIAIHNC